MPRVSVGLAELPTIPHFLYRFFDRTDALLYIGITNDPKTRFRWHRKNQPWWSDVDQTKTRIEYCPTREAALEAERKAIVEESPLYNDQHNLTVDTPQRKAAAEAVSDFASLMLSHLLVHPAEVKKVIQEAENEIASLLADGDEPYERNPVILAATNYAERVPTLVNVYRGALDSALEWLPGDVVWPAHEQAGQELGIDPSTWNGDNQVDIVEAAMPLIKDEMSRRYLGDLDPNEAEEWRRSARTFLSSRAWHQHDATDDEVTRHAAAYAKSVQDGMPYLLSAYQCREAGRFTPRCPNEGEYRLTFKNCPQCKSEGCSGHESWCSDHLSELRAGQFVWALSGEALVVATATETEPSGRAKGQAA